MASSMDNKPNSGLASCLSNVFKLAEVDGLKWIRYIGPTSSCLEAPKSDPVLTSYANLLNDGYACSWRRQSPSTDGTSGEGKDLWIFYFTSLPDLTGKLASELKEDGSGSWDEGMSPESSAMLFRALNSLIERSLLSENFLPLGKWYARPDPSMGSDGRGCFLCNFSFFIHAHRYICASVDVRAGPALQLLQTSHLHQALSSSSGMQVILSPSGLNGIMTGHSYRSTDLGIDDLLDEWKLFYPRRFECSLPSQLPAAVEVVLGGVRLRYPSQFVFVYHTEDSIPTPPPSPLNESMIGKVIQGGWEDTMSVDPSLQQKQCEGCSCQHKLAQRDISLSSKPSRPHRLLPGGAESVSERSSRRSFRIHNAHPTDNATPMREHPTPSSLSLTSTTLNTRRKQMGPPKYATPLPSPAVTIPSSPAIKQPFPHNHTSLAPPLSSVTLSSVPSTPLPPGTSPGPPGRSGSVYDGARVSDMVKTSRGNEKGFCDYLSYEDGWWACLDLPESIGKMQKMLNPLGQLRIGLPHPPVGGANISSTMIPGIGQQGISPFPNSGERRISSDGNKTTPTKKRPNSGKRLRGGPVKVPKRGSNEVATSATMLSTDDPMDESDAVRSITIEENMDILGNGPLTGAGSNKTSSSSVGGVDLTSANAVKVEDCLGNLFDDSDEDEAHDTNTPVSMDTTDLKGNTATALKAIKSIDPATSIHPLDFSHIYPTPPSVESLDEKFDEGKTAGAGAAGGVAFMDEKVDVMEQAFLTRLCPLTDVLSETVPKDFQPLSDLSSSNFNYSKQHTVYKPKSSKSLSTISKAKQNKGCSSLSSSSQSLKSEPQKFIFPPPSSLIARPNLTLPLNPSLEHTMSPLLSTPYSSSPLRIPGRMTRPHPLSAQTPLESPFDSITPTPMSSSRLVPILPEAHALYLSLALLDSALGANVSDNVTVDLSAIQNIIKARSTFRQRLDSVGSIPGGSTSSAMFGAGGTEEDSVLKFEDEKPLMMLGIADYPSLGFREELVGNVPTSDGGNILLNMLGLDKVSNTDNNHRKTVQSFLSLVQDYCLHLCLTGKQEVGSVPTATLGTSTSTTPISGSLQPYQQQFADKQHSKEICRLYHTQSVSSAIMCGKQLVVSGNRVFPNRAPQPPSSAGLSHQSSINVTLDKEDNSASWILDLLSLPTKFVTKKLKELKTVFQSSFHHAPCIRVSTKGPLSLRDLQNLTPHSPAGDDCLPLPMQPLMVGCDHEWLTVSPLALTAWDKLMLEPYSSQKHILYLVLSPGGDTFTDTLKTFFCNLSVTYKNCKLGAHIPLDKDTWSHGIITNADKLPNTDITQEDKKPTAEELQQHSQSNGIPSLEKVCKNVINNYLTNLPVKSEDLLQCSTLVNETTPSKSVPVHSDIPVCIVLYIIMRGGAKDKKRHLARGRMGQEMDEAINEQVIDVMRVFSGIIANEDIPMETRNRLVIQPLDESELIGPHSNTTQHVRSLAFSVFSRCRPVLSLKPHAHHMTGFGPLIDKPQQKFAIKLLSPLYILSPDPLLLPNPLTAQQSQPSTILFAPDECTLNCAYCVSSDQKWLLSIVCDRQAELLDSCVIGLQQNDIDGSNCREALRNLWVYLLSVMSSSVIKWNLVITRLGKPSATEIREWPRIISEDGLMTANLLLSQDCASCSLSGQQQQPSLKNVIFVSVQPERNIQLFPQMDPDTSVSHILILPPHPNSNVTEMTPTDASIFDEFLTADTGPDNSDINIDDDLFQGIETWGAIENQTSSFAHGAEAANLPLATGYLISTTPPGYLPPEFWGYEKPQSVCNMFKVILHSQLSHTFPGRPPDVLCSVLLTFDALSWLSINQITRKRNSSLPIHLYLLSKLYNFFSLFSNPR